MPGLFAASRAETAIVAIGTIGETARELLADDDAPLVARVHAYRPFPGAELALALEHAKHVCVIDRAPACGTVGPLGEDVRAYGLPGAVDVLCGLGGSDVTPDTLRDALRASGREAVYLGVEA